MGFRRLLAIKVSLYYNLYAVKVNTKTKVIVTGVSSGIGRALTKALVGDGAQVLGVARSKDRLNSLSVELSKSPGKFTFLALDLKNPQNRSQLVSWVKKNWNQLDILVNNAGIFYPQKVVQGDMTEIRELMEVNFFTPVELIIKLFPMVKNDGMVINVLSPALYRSHPKAGFYTASKAALRSITWALRGAESRGVKVLGYYPGIVRTEIFKEEKRLPILVKLLQVSPGFTAQKIIQQIKHNKEGEYYEPVAILIKLAGIFGI